jgi:hypothetical protein
MDDFDDEGWKGMEPGSLRPLVLIVLLFWVLIFAAVYFVARYVPPSLPHVG